MAQAKAEEFPALGFVPCPGDHEAADEVAKSLPVTVRQAEFWVPLKRGPGAVLFAFTTQDVRHWAQYVEVFSGIVKSISDERV